MNHSLLHDVMNNCQQTINTLYRVASQIPDPRVRNKLSESAHHLRHCVEDCRFASQKLHQQDFSYPGQWGVGAVPQGWGSESYPRQQFTATSPLQIQNPIQTPVFV